MSVPKSVAPTWADRQECLSYKNLTANKLTRAGARAHTSIHSLALSKKQLPPVNRGQLENLKRLKRS
jgi:hypothetical protein